MSARSAEYAIKGFIYQFNLSALKILNSTESESITLEGIIEDIEVTTMDSVEALQCKYHETSSFNLSAFYRPVLLMLKDYRSKNLTNWKFTLHAHVKNQSPGECPLFGLNEIKEIFQSKNKKLAPLIAEVKTMTDNEILKFLSQFKFEYGKSLEDLKNEVITLLRDEVGCTEEDVKEVYYPNLITQISEICSLPQLIDRTKDKASIINPLKTLKTTLFTRWSIELFGKETILKIKRKQLSSNLNSNSRVRFLVINPEVITDFDLEIITFVKDFLAKYFSKPTLNLPPTLIINCDESTLDNLLQRLHARDIIVNFGHVSPTHFDIGTFNRRAKVVSKEKSEFDIRVARLTDDVISALNAKLPDDYFIIDKRTSKTFEGLNFQDLNVEYFEVESFQELRYLLGISNTF